MSQLKAQVDKMLTNVSSAYIPDGFIVEAMLPAIKSAQSTGLLGKYGKNHLRIENTIKSGRGKYRRIESMTSSTQSFYIKGHGLEGLVTKEDYANKLLPFDAEKDETMGLTTTLWLEKEFGLASTLTNTSVLTQNVTLSGTSQLSDYTNSDPVGVFSAARQAIMDGCGVAANVAAMDYNVWNKLRFHPKILDSLGFKYNQIGGLSIDQLAIALGVEKVFIAKARYNSAKEGQADVLAPVWGKHIVFGVLPEKAMTYQKSLAYLVGFEGDQPRKVYKQSGFNPPGSTEILVEDNYDMLIADAGAGYLVKDAIA